MDDGRPVIALTGATGYVGGLLIQPLGEIASEVRCLTRNPARLQNTDLPGNAVAVRADTTDHLSLLTALKGCDVAFYLVHSLNEGKSFARLEAESAQTFANAAWEAGVKRIIYLGALAQNDADHTSAHIESRHRVGKILQSTGVPVTEFRASVIIGAGSMPFEAIRALVERLPVMVTPRWVRMPVQPIFSGDLINYLVTAACEQSDQSHLYEVGGANVTTYADLMHAYAKERGLRRFMIPVPVITPRLSSLWLKLVTPAHYRIGKNIVDSTAHSSVVADDSALRDFEVKPLSVEEAIKRALEDEERGLKFLDQRSETDASVDRMRVGTRFVESRKIAVDADTDTVFDVLSRVGGENGWFYGNWLWKTRGLMDRVIGGPGLRRKVTEYPPVPGKKLDFWTVKRAGPDRLTLRADMRLPGEAYLDLAVKTVGDQTFVEQTASFDPRGLFGLVYWFALYPIHSLVFSGMLKGIKRSADTSRGKEIDQPV